MAYLDIATIVISVVMIGIGIMTLCIACSFYKVFSEAGKYVTKIDALADRMDALETKSNDFSERLKTLEERRAPK